MNQPLHEPISNTPKLLPIFLLLVTILALLLFGTYRLAASLAPDSRDGQLSIHGTTTGQAPGEVAESPAADATPLAHLGWDAFFFADLALESQCADPRVETGLYLFLDSAAGWAPPEGCPGAAEPWNVRMESQEVYFDGGEYQFVLLAAGAARLYLDDQLIIDGWEGAQTTASHTLGQGYYPLRLEYRHDEGQALLELWWHGPGAIPAHEDTQGLVGWRASYWGNQAQWRDPVVVSLERSELINHAWGSGGPGWGLPGEHFSARFERTLFLECGSYEFHLKTDDGSRLTLDGVIIPEFDHWTTGEWDTTAILALEAGDYEVIVDYFESSEKANLHLEWMPISLCTPTPVPEPTITPRATAAPCPGCGLAGSAWPMFRKDLQHTGRSAYSGPEAPEVKWTSYSGTLYGSDPAIGADGYIYVGLGNDLVVFSSAGYTQWRYSTGATVRSSLIATDGSIYFGNDAGNLFALNSKGSVRWIYPTGGWIAASPAVGTDGTIYFGSSDRYFYAIDPNGTLKWRYYVGSWINSSPAIGAGGIIYFGSTNHYVYALNPDGTLRWRYATGGYVDSSPAIGADGTIYVGSFDQYVYALNPDGSLKWRYLTGGAVGSSPAIATDGTVYVGSEDAKLYALKPDGSLKWTYQSFGRIRSSPAIGADGTIYFGSDDTLIYAVNPDGYVKWGLGLGGRPVTKGPVIGSNGSLYMVGSGVLFNVNEEALPTRTPTKTSTPTRTATPTKTPVHSPTFTATPTRTGTVSASPTLTQSPTSSPTSTLTPTATLIPSPTPESANLAVNRPVTVSSFQDASHSGAMAVDDDLTTYWQSARAYGSNALMTEWIEVDLGEVATLDRVVLEWNQYYASSFTIRVSADGIVWSTVYDTALGDGESDLITFDLISARYVRMDSSVWANRMYRCWLNEFQIFGVLIP